MEPAAKRLKTESNSSAKADVNDGKRYQLWGPTYTKEERAEFEMDETSVFSVTDSRTADRITKLMQGLSGGPFSSVLDGCACVGGNVLSFGRALLGKGNVSAIEFDKNRYQMLCHNVTVAKLNENVKCYHGDFAKFLETEDAPAAQAIRTSEIIFLDPPWGGRAVDSAPMGTVELTLGGLSLHTICSKLCSFRTRYILFKLPPNYNFSKLELDLNKENIAENVRLEKSLRKMVLVVVSLKSSPPAASTAGTESQDPSSSAAEAAPVLVNDDAPTSHSSPAAKKNTDDTRRAAKEVDH